MASDVPSNRKKKQVLLIKTKPHPQHKIPEGKTAWDRTEEYFTFFTRKSESSWKEHSHFVIGAVCVWCMFFFFFLRGLNGGLGPLGHGPTSLGLWGWKLRPAGRFIYSRLREKDLLIDPPLEKSHYHVWDERVGTQDLLRDLLVKKGKIYKGSERCDEWWMAKLASTASDCLFDNHSDSLNVSAKNKILGVKREKQSPPQKHRIR